MQVHTIKDNVYIPDMAKLIKKTKMTPNETLFEFEFIDTQVRDLFTYKPGQFVQVSVLGIGEAPFSISSSPTRPGTLELGIRNTGDVTAAIHKLEVGAKVGIRGPYGNGFPMHELKGKDLLIVAGGIGLVPLRSVINYVADTRDDFGKLTLMFGTSKPSERVFVEELEKVWTKVSDYEILQTVDRAEEGWAGNVGVVTTLFGKTVVDSSNAVALICGPPIMYKFVVRDLLKLKFLRDDILLSLERRMKCGIGKCAHCQVGHKLTCVDGPVFTYFEAERLMESI